MLTKQELANAEPAIAVGSCPASARHTPPAGASHGSAVALLPGKWLWLALAVGTGAWHSGAATCCLSRLLLSWIWTGICHERKT
jgi:hypothetical protein